MIVGSTKEDILIEKRISITPESAKNILNLDIGVCLESNYAVHLGITDKEFENLGVKFYKSSKEVIEK